jgi:hypothetical protein
MCSSMFVFAFLPCFDPAFDTLQSKYLPVPWMYVAAGILPEKQELNVRSHEVTFQVLDSLDVEHPYFFVPLRVRINNETVYIGVGRFMQRTLIDRKEVMQMILTGIYSRWGTIDTKHCRKPEFGYSIGYDHEDDHVTNRTACHIVPGHRYTVKISLAETSKDEQNQDAVWVQATITDRETGTAVDLGQLRFRGKELKVQFPFGSFLERAGTQEERINIISRRKIYDTEIPPRLRVIVGDWKADNQPIPFQRSYANYVEKTPDNGRAFTLANCPDEFRNGVSKQFDPKSAIMMCVDSQQWVRPSTLGRAPLRSSELTRGFDKLIQNELPKIYRFEELHKP